MKKQRSVYNWLLPAAGILLLLFGREHAATGVQSGLLLCGRVLIPSLFPLCVLSQCLLRTADRALLEKTAGPWMGRLFGLPGVCAVPFLLGLIGGFPLGAQLTVELYKSGSISRRDAEKLSALSSQAGPAYLLGAVGTGLLGSTAIGGLLFGLQLSSAFLTGMLFRKDSVRRRSISFSESGSASLPAALSASVGGAALAMLRMSGAVVFFRALIGCIEGLFPLASLPVCLRAGLSGALELSGGVSLLQGSEPFACFLLTSSLVNWGGLCVYLQVSELLSGLGLSLKQYLLFKLAQALLSSLLALGVGGLLWGSPLWAPVSAFFIPLFTAFFVFFQKNRLENGGNCAIMKKKTREALSCCFERVSQSSAPIAPTPVRPPTGKCSAPKGASSLRTTSAGVSATIP